jgi:hypothetical protein
MKLILKRFLAVLIVLIILCFIGTILISKSSKCTRALDASPQYYKNCVILEPLGIFLIAPFYFISVLIRPNYFSIERILLAISYLIIETGISLCISMLIVKKK